MDETKGGTPNMTVSCSEKIMLVGRLEEWEDINGRVWIFE